MNPQAEVLASAIKRVQGDGSASSDEQSVDSDEGRIQGLSFSVLLKACVFGFVFGFMVFPSIISILLYCPPDEEIPSLDKDGTTVEEGEFSTARDEEKEAKRSKKTHAKKQDHTPDRYYTYIYM